MLNLSRIRSFLFKNERWGQALAKNLVWLALGQGSVRLVRMAVILIVVRGLGPEEYGRFALAYSFVTLLTSVLEGGVLTVASREFAADPAKERYLPDVLALKVISNLSAAVLVLPGMFWVTADAVVRHCIVVLLAQQFFLEVGTGFYAATRARGRMEFESAFALLQNVMLLVFTVTALRFSSSALTVSIAQLIAAVFWLTALFFLLWKSGYRIQSCPHWANIKSLGLMCLPLLLGGIATAVYTNIDSIILGKTGNLIQVGLYNAAVKVVQGVLLVPITLGTIAVVPAFASLIGEPGSNLSRRWNKWRTLLILGGGYMAAMFFAGAQPIVLAAFGPRFLPAVPVMRVILVSVALMYISTPYSQALIVFGKQGTLFVCQAIAAVVSVAGNVFAIPRFGMLGAAWTAAVAQGVLLLLCMFVAPRHTPLLSSELGYRNALAGSTICATLVVFCTFHGMNPIVVCVFATCLFGGLAAFATRRSIGNLNIANSGQ